MTDFASSPNSSPEDVDPELWRRYLAGCKALERKWATGERCPTNPDGARCRCQRPATDICRYWIGVESLAKQIGGAEWELVEKMK